MPIPEQNHRLFTIDEYLPLERTDEERHEYLDVAHMRAAPDVLAPLGFRHQAAGLRDQIAQHRQRPRS